jgi:uncharacterized protein YlxW (UPF0749 family)
MALLEGEKLMNRIILTLSVFLLCLSAEAPAENIPGKASEEVTADAGSPDQTDTAREERQKRRAQRARQRKEYHQKMKQFRWGQTEGAEDQ